MRRWGHLPTVSSPLPCRALAGTAPQTISSSLAVQHRTEPGTGSASWPPPPTGLWVTRDAAGSLRLCILDRLPSLGARRGGEASCPQQPPATPSMSSWRVQGDQPPSLAPVQCGQLTADSSTRNLGPRGISRGLWAISARSLGHTPAAQTSSFLSHPYRAQPATEDSLGALDGKSQDGSGTGDLGRWVGRGSSRPSPQTGNCLCPSVGLRSSGAGSEPGGDRTGHSSPRLLLAGGPRSRGAGGCPLPQPGTFSGGGYK